MGPLDLNLSRLGIRKKLMLLHTGFFLALAAILLVSLRPAVTSVVAGAELDQAKLVLAGLASQLERGVADPAPPNTPGLSLRRGDADQLDLDAQTSLAASLNPGLPQRVAGDRGGARAVLFARVPGDDGAYWVASVRSDEARQRVTNLYLLVTGALLGVYALIAAALEMLVLPKQVYGPISRALAADRAVREGRTDDELIPSELIPADELGEVMRSRNASIVALRSHQAALAEALTRLESVANDLKRKNHLLETAQKNLADADRLASLGMMSAGIAHELNTPLAVLKGSVEQIAGNPAAGVDPDRARLMLRVVSRLERLGESLLDFARVRPPTSARVAARGITQEALTLVRLDRDTGDIDLVDSTPDRITVECDADRMVQVFVNLLRNAVDAIRGQRPARSDGASQQRARVEITAETQARDGADWVVFRIADNGPGIDPAILHRLFEPFASTRLDSKGTGLGLAVAEGIVREHGGVVIAANQTGGPGAVFEVVLPDGTRGDHTPPETRSASPARIGHTADAEPAPEHHA